jgi:hypothetical protein
MHSKYQTKQSNVVYKSEWMTVYEDQVYKGNDVTSKVGMFKRIDVCDTAIVIPLFIVNGRELQAWCGYRSSGITRRIY